jgi:uncharacterized alkaline shock family protein YloU
MMRVKVHPEVIRLIAVLSVLEVDGVTRAVSRMPLSHDPKRAARMKVEDGKIQLELHLAFRYGVDILATARLAQDTVKRAVENLVGAEVTSIDIVVEDIDIQRADAQAEG